MKISICNMYKILSTMSMIMLVMAALTGYLGYTFLLDLNVDRSRQLERVRDTEWYFIEAILSENYDKAQNEADLIKDEVVEDIQLGYKNDKQSLKQDLVNPTEGSRILTIFRDNIKGRYMNDIRNDRNDPFIMSVKGMYTDLSLNRAIQIQNTQPKIREWESEYVLHANPKLMKQAMSNFIEQSNKPVFWEFIASPDPNHRKVELMELSELRKVYETEGVNGLRTYEFGKAAYIFDHEDLFGIPDVNASGAYTKNDKIIVVSGFSLYDVLVLKYSPTLARYDDMNVAINLRYDYTKQEITSTVATVVSLFLIGFFVISYMQHLIVVRNVSRRAGGEDANGSTS